jgi:CDP-diacylglycerol--glycerol-3-phosphate 3-phosphatidyltransferase
MPSVYDIKPAFQSALRPIVRSCAKLGITPNQFTLSAALLSIAAGVWIASAPTNPRILLVLPAVLFLRMALNAIDGMLAREHNMTSRLGLLLNELGDVVADAALYLPLALVPSINPHLVVAFVVLAGITELAGLLALPLGHARTYHGPMGKSDRALLIGLLALIIGLGVSPDPWVTPLLMLAILLECLTVLNRCRAALTEPEKTGS